MSHSEKPFACTTEGCNMSFVNEDHLTVHKKKHDMILNLGINSKNNFFIADQTPTPTRFIRNCDEVGLFQDLHNENPFEETFRRAVEAGKTGILTGSEVEGNDDSLHTPNIFPHITEECTSSVTNKSANQSAKPEIKNFNESLTTVNTESHKEIIQTISNEVNSKLVDNTTTKEDSVFQNTPELSSGNSSTAKPESHLPIDGAEMQLLLKTQDGKVLRFIAAPVLNEKDSLSNQTVNTTVEPKVIVNNSKKSNSSKVEDQKLSAAKMKLKETLIKNGTVAETKSIKNNENVRKPTETVKEKSVRNPEHSRKQSILERNRASSMRARAKRKAWIEQLQQSLKVANETNANLQVQLKNLHGQVAKLKALLLAHKDCPVTRAMEKGNGIVVGSKVLTIKSNEVKQAPTAAGPAKPAKRSSTEKPIVPKKRPLILSTVKNPIILPKSQPATNAITLHGAEVIKTVPTISIVTPLIANSENCKTILGFLRPEPGKVPLMQEAITYNENFNENAASKTTGT